MENDWVLFDWGVESSHLGIWETLGKIFPGNMAEFLYFLF
jgi:hypothetical protein